MSRPLIVSLLTLSAIALAMAQTTPNTNSTETLTTPTMIPTTPTTIPTTETPVSLSSCNALNKFNETALMEAKKFVKNLDECTKSKDNKTFVATVLVDLVKKINTTRYEMANLTDYPVFMKRISECAHAKTGFNFNETETRKHFGLPNTVAFKFGPLECETSLELADCVESVYAGYLNATTKRHKNVYMRLFDGIVPFCRNATIRKYKNNGQYSVPSFTLIMGSALMILKLLL